MNARDQLLRKARRTNQEIDYKRKRNKVNGMIKICKNKYHRDLLQENASSLNKFWSAIKKIYPTKLTKEPGVAFLINGTKTTDKLVIANCFSNFFTNVARTLKKKFFRLCDFA